MVLPQTLVKDPIASKTSNIWRTRASTGARGGPTAPRMRWVLERGQARPWAVLKVLRGVWRLLPEGNRDMLRAKRLQRRRSMFSKMPQGTGDVCMGPAAMRWDLQEPQGLLPGWWQARWGSQEPRTAPNHRISASEPGSKQPSRPKEQPRLQTVTGAKRPMPAEPPRPRPGACPLPNHPPG